MKQVQFLLLRFLYTGLLFGLSRCSIYSVTPDLIIAALQHF